MILLTVRLAQFILRNDVANRAHVVLMGYVPLWQAQLGYALKIAPALSEVFHENEALLDRVEDETIGTYVDLIRNAGRETRYVDFLIVLCSAKGKAVQSNQNRICLALLQKAPELVLSLHERAAKRGGGGVEIVVRGDSRYFSKLEGEPTLASWLDQDPPPASNLALRCQELGVRSRQSGIGSRETGVRTK
jgi:hypothetical protein